MADDDVDDESVGDEEFEVMSAEQRNRRRIEERRRERRRERLDRYDSSANTFEQDAPHETPGSERLTGRSSGRRRLGPLIDVLDSFADKHPVFFALAVVVGLAVCFYALLL